jgi:hypothetical protein
MQVIIFQNGSGVSVCVPAPDALARFGIDAIARKDVPAGRPYKIIDDSELPDRATRALWTVDVADLTDGVGSDSDEFPPELLEGV